MDNNKVGWYYVSKKIDHLDPNFDFFAVQKSF